MPEPWSATDHGVQAMATVVELLGAYALPTPIFPTAVDAALLIGRLATPGQREALLPEIAAGRELAAVALEEPAVGPPGAADQLGTTATRVARSWRLRGTKLYVPYVNAARRVLCVARVGDGEAAVFDVPADATGLTLTRLRTSNGDPLFAVDFDDVVVGDAALLGDKSAAWADVAAMRDTGAALKAAEMVGIGRRVLALTQELVGVREQFGRPIGAFQAVQHHVADMYRALEQTRVLTQQAVALLDNGAVAPREVSLAKVKAGEALDLVINLAAQLHGGVGYYTDYPLETYFRRTIAAQGAYGSARWHRRRLADLLRDDADAFRRAGAHPLAQT